MTKTIEILSELRVALRYDVQPEYCRTLAGLYSYMQGQLIRAHSEQSESLLLEVSRLLQTLLEGWTGAMEKLSSAQQQQAAEAAVTAAASAAGSGQNPYSGSLRALGQWSGVGSFSLIAPEFSSHHLRDPETSPSRQALSESLLRHFHGQLSGLIVAGTQPSTIGGFARGFQHLSDDEGFELRGRLRICRASRPVGQALGEMFPRLARLG